MHQAIRAIRGRKRADPGRTETRAGARSAGARAGAQGAVCGRAAGCVERARPHKSVITLYK